PLHTPCSPPDRTPISLAFYSIHRHHPNSPLFPYTTLFRSDPLVIQVEHQRMAVSLASLERLAAHDDEAHAGRALETLARSGYHGDRKSTRLNSSHQIISYAVFCLKKKKTSTVSI